MPKDGFLVTESMAFFCKANSRQVIYGPEGKYPQSGQGLP